MNGAALGTTLAYLSMAIALYVVAQRLYYITYEWTRLVKLVFVAATVFVLGYWIWTAPWQKAVLLIGFPVALFLIGFFEKGELKRIATIFQKDEVQLRARTEKQESSIKGEL
jgi:hypothetical protein